MTQLLPCPNCSRHVRINEARCPFCSVPLEAPGVSRLGALAVGVTMALAGCTAQQPEVNQVKPVATSTPATTQGAVVAPTTRPEPERMDAPAYGLAPKPDRPKNKYGAPPPPKKP